MRRAKTILLLLIVGMFLSASAPTLAQVPFGWQKISGQSRNYSGVADGIVRDRENSYAWCMEILNGYLYVGTNRNVVGSMLGRLLPPNQWPATVPTPTDNQARIYRMKLSTGAWELFYLAPSTNPGPPITGPDDGYRMMKTFKTRTSGSVLYVGSMGSSCRLMAITPDSTKPIQVFGITNPGYLPFGFSIRAITEHAGLLFWASDYFDQATMTVHPAIWYASDPLYAYTQNNAVVFPYIDVPAEWFPRGAEIMDMISYNGSLYVFFLNHDLRPEATMGFWVGKVTWTRNGWVWKLIVGDQNLGAKYPPGLGDTRDAGATSPIIFRNKVYVGTGGSTMVRFFATGQFDTGGADVETLGAKIYRFDQGDRWTRVEPSALFGDARFNGFVNPLNQYTWRFGVHGGKLYVGTFDARTLLDQFGAAVGLDIPGLINPSGFDMYSTMDGTIWLPETLDGFNDEFNYGGRAFVTDPNTGIMYLGTANPFYGCQIWRKRF